MDMQFSSPAWGGVVLQRRFKFPKWESYGRWSVNCGDPELPVSQKK
jgi:hypothetical protein